MDETIVALYCACDDFLKACGHVEPKHGMTDAEVMTTALVAAWYFGGNHEQARQLLKSPAYIPRMLSKSRFNRRLHALEPIWWRFFRVLGDQWKQATSVFLVDSFPIPVCDNIRIRRCRLYRHEVYRGKMAGKRRFFYGLRVHWITTASGKPVECFLAPGSFADVSALQVFDFDLPPGSRVVGDGAYNHYAVEDLLSEAAGIALQPARKKNSTRPRAPWAEYLRSYERNRIETATSLIERRLPKSLHAVTAKGFELKVFLSIIAYSLSFVI